MLNKRLHNKSRRNCRGASEITEFAPVLFVLFIVILIPLLDFTTVFVAAAIQYLATNDFAAKAGVQTTYASALSSMVAEATQFEYYGMARFVNLTPAAGYMGCGDDMYVVATNINNGATTKTAANQPFTTSIDTSANMYELSVKSTYSISPLISMEKIPLLSSVPGLGAPCILTFVANRPVENPAGLQSNANNGPGGGGNVAVLPRTYPCPAVAPTPGTASGVWRTPNIYQQIANSGQKVISTSTVLVNANSLPYTATQITATQGQTMWIDTQAVGLWAATPFASDECDANGNSKYVNPNATAPSITPGALLGEIGSLTPFKVGDTLLNYPLTSNGSFSMAMNDNMYTDNIGAQLVRVVLTSN